MLVGWHGSQELINNLKINLITGSLQWISNQTKQQNEVVL